MGGYLGHAFHGWVAGTFVNVVELNAANAVMFGNGFKRFGHVGAHFAVDDEGYLGAGIIV